MAKQVRTAPKSKPITANPLFPAVVALWFGALFGLSSLAVRVSVIEALVMKSGIDLIVPAAAPPLGITARILVALILAALGALIGAAIARRLARPKAEERERKRSVRTSEAEEPRVRSRDSHPDAPARRPISAHEELGGDDAVNAPAAPGLLAGRRRGLTAETEQSHFVPPEFAPLPGGLPQILDLAGAELDRAEEIPAQSAPAVLAEAPAIAPAADLNAYADAPSAAAEPPAPVAVPDEPVTAPVAALASAAEDHGLLGRQVFGMAPVEPQDPAERQIFGVRVEGDEPAVDLVKDLGFQTSVFAAPAAPSLFADRADPAPAALPEPIASVAPVAAMPPVSDLDMTKLALRLQESMKRRRAARAAVSTQPVVEAVPNLSRFGSDAVPAPMAAAAVIVPDPIPAPAAFAPDPVPAPAPLPAAMRPLSFDDPGDDEDHSEALASLVPPRHIALPQGVPVMATDAPTPDVADNAVIGENDDEDDTLADEAAFASLLGVNAPASRPSFVRIEEPEAATDQFEPVVIFPGQASAAMSPGAISDVAPVVSPVPEEHSGFRRFDAPAAAGQGQPIAGNSAAPALDAEEAERSLRSALANLQRISGAA
ncbi:MAG: hypothetical protein ACKOQ3_13715 [Novosphingobium sp.]